MKRARRLYRALQRMSRDAERDLKHGDGWAVLWNQAQLNRAGLGDRFMAVEAPQ